MPTTAAGSYRRPLTARDMAGRRLGPSRPWNVPGGAPSARSARIFRGSRGIDCRKLRGHPFPPWEVLGQGRIPISKFSVKADTPGLPRPRTGPPPGRTRDPTPAAQGGGSTDSRTVGPGRLSGTCFPPLSLIFPRREIRASRTPAARVSPDFGPKGRILTYWNHSMWGAWGPIEGFSRKFP